MSKTLIFDADTPSNHLADTVMMFSGVSKHTKYYFFLSPIAGRRYPTEGSGDGWLGRRRLVNLKHLLISRFASVCFQISSFEVAASSFWDDSEKKVRARGGHYFH